MKIGILYICTGQYDVFWKDFYLSCEQFFLKAHDIHYFVFTDKEEIFGSEKSNNIHIFPQKNLWRPDNTLMRFHIFLSQETILEKMDYLFFCNANLLVKQEIWDEILPTKEGIVVCQHAWFYNKKNTLFSYERNPLSTAYIKKWDGDIYVQWALNGWKSKDFLSMCKVLADNIDRDKAQGITAIWHDESHLNRYILRHPHKVLDPSYLCPELPWYPIQKAKILIRDKSQWIDVHSIKWQKHNVIRTIVIALQALITNLSQYINRLRW